MDEVLGQRHSTNPPVLIASIPENTPGPSTASTAVVDQEVEDKDQEEERQRGPRSRKRKRERKRGRHVPVNKRGHKATKGGRGEKSPGAVLKKLPNS